MKPLLSAVIIAKNEAERIADCLNALAFCDEIVVVDSGSTDATKAICRTRGARVIEHGWLGYGNQKRFAVAQASHDWVLCVDADEIVGAELRGNIELALTLGNVRAYELPRRNRFMGRWLGFGEGYPDWCLRLFDRRVAEWSNDTVHEKVMTREPVGRLTGDLLHDSASSLDMYLAKQNHYTSLQAEALIASGKRVGMLKVFVSPVLRFIKFYLLRQGFRDGLPGLVHISIGCFNSFCKYAKVAAATPRAVLTLDQPAATLE